jgi:hypothetical protein
MEEIVKASWQFADEMLIVGDLWLLKTSQYM